MPLTRAQMIDLLNGDLASEYAAVIQYLTYAAKVTGPNRNELSEFLQEEIAGETEHAKFLADKIVALGGTPTVLPADVPQVADNKACSKLSSRQRKPRLPATPSAPNRPKRWGRRACKSSLRT
jgi:ferritin-like protein